MEGLPPGRRARPGGLREEESGHAPSPARLAAVLAPALVAASAHAKPPAYPEGAYEAGSERGFEVSPLWVRRQAYTSYLAGGHHTYGHNDSCRILPT